MPYHYLLAGLLFVTAACPEISARTLNGFALDDTLIPAAEIVSGGPPRDGIPALTEPELLRIDQHPPSPLQLRQRVLGIATENAAKAYPIAILNFHELVNDRIGGQPVLVSWCPLCGTGMAFSRRVDGKELTFGVSGLLYNNNLLMYDRESLSLWSQASGQAISGVHKGTKLVGLAVAHLPLAAWVERHPSSWVLTRNTGYARDYDRNPYPDYAASERLYFPLAHRDRRYPTKEWVVAVHIKGHAKAYPYQELERAALPLTDAVGGLELQIDYDRARRYATITAVNGAAVPVIYSYWFSWVATYPDTQVFRVDRIP